MKPVLTIIIEGEGADVAAQKLIELSNRNGVRKMVPSSSDTPRGVDIIEIVEFATRNLFYIAMSAYTLWKWRQEIKGNADVLLRKETESGIKPMSVPKNGSVEDIEGFLEDMDETPDPK